MDLCSLCLFLDTIETLASLTISLHFPNKNWTNKITIPNINLTLLHSRWEIPVVSLFSWLVWSSFSSCNNVLQSNIIANMYCCAHSLHCSSTRPFSLSLSLFVSCVLFVGWIYCRHHLLHLYLVCTWDCVLLHQLGIRSSSSRRGRVKR